MHVADISKDNRTLGDLAGRLGRLGLVVGVILLLVALGIHALTSGGGEAAPADGAHSAELPAWGAFLRAYLVAFSFVTSICLGALLWVMIEFATKAGWSVVVRRIAEALASNLRWLWIAFIPIAVGMWFSDTTGLYEWAMSSAADDEVLLKKAAYLNKGFWLARSALYFLIWAWLAHFYLRTSSAQDLTGSPELTLRMQGRSYVGILLVGLSLTFASIDWIMSLEPRWFSTIFGVYFFAGAFCGFFAAMIVILKLLQRSGRLTHTITREHYQDLGKLLFAFGIVFWAYIAYSQFMLIWYASLPEETTFYLIRMLGEWRVIGLLLIFGHFFGPFLAILSRHSKRNEQWLLVAAVWMLFMQFIDVYWLVMPHVPVQAVAEAPNYPALQEQFKDLSVGFTLAHPVTLAAMVALLVAGTAFALRNRSLIPERDPRLRESLGFENF